MRLVKSGICQASLLRMQLVAALIGVVRTVLTANVGFRPEANRTMIGFKHRPPPSNPFRDAGCAVHD